MNKVRYMYDIKFKCENIMKYYNLNISVIIDVTIMANMSN